MGEHPADGGGSGGGISGAAGASTSAGAVLTLAMQAGAEASTQASGDLRLYRADDRFLTMLFVVSIAVPMGAWALGTFVRLTWVGSLLITALVTVGSAAVASRFGVRVFTLAGPTVTPRLFLPGRMRQCLTCFFGVKPSG